MTKPNDSAGSDSDVFVCADVVANAVNVVRLREELAQWLRQHFVLDSLRLNDVILAVNEALANVAEFAYRHDSQPGTMDIRAAHERATAILTITVSDHGSWRDASEREPKRTRGRGIPLMEALSDEMRIEPGAQGTTVSMRFGEVSATAAKQGDEVTTC